MLLRGHYQNSYVTRDLNRAIEVMQTQYKIESLHRFEADMVLSTPQGPQAAFVRAASGWLGAIELEIVEPVSGCVDYYRDCLPVRGRDDIMALHHIGLRRDLLSDVYADIERVGAPIVNELAFEGGHCIYVDTRPTWGHYLEFVARTPEGWKQVGWPDWLPAP